MLDTLQSRTAASQPALALLFGRFVAGEVNDAALNQFMDAFDSLDATPEEREAFARFYNDALLDLGAQSIRMPRLEELRELLSDTHA